METIQQILSALTALVMALGAQISSLPPSSQLAQVYQTPAFVQGNAAQSAWDGSSVSVTLNGTTEGNLLAVYVMWASGSVTLSGITSPGVTGGFTLIENPTTHSTSYRVAGAYGVITAGGSNAITATFSGQNGGYAKILIHEISGINTSSPLDDSSSNPQTDAGATTNTITSNNMTTTQDNDYIFAATAGLSGTNVIYTTGTGFTPRTMLGTNLLSESTIQTQPGQIAGTFTQSVSWGDTLTIAMAFRPALSSLPLPSDSAPQITSFTATPSTITAGQSVNLSWSVSGSPAPTITIDQGVGNMTNQTSVSVSLLTTTNYTLTAQNSVSIASQAISVTVNPLVSDTQAPTVPTGLSATAISSSQINLSWTASTDDTGVVGYKIYRGGNQIATSTSTTYSDTSLSASTQYSYTVSAYDNAGNVSTQPSLVSATTQPSDLPPTNDLIPSDRKINWGNVGIPGGIPTINTVCATLDVGTYGNGVTDSTNAIQTAINNCPAGQVVYLPAGIYKISSRLNLTKTVVLRGDSLQTKIKVYGTDVGIRMGQGSGGPATSLAGSYDKGSSQVTLSQDATISAGQYVIVDELNPSIVDNPRTYLCEDRSGGGYRAGSRCIAQINKVLSKSGTNLTLEHPLYFSYDSTLNPRVYIWNMIENVGIENIFIERAENVGTGNSHIIQIMGCAYCWVKNVETYKSRGDHIQLWYSYANEISDNFINTGHNDYTPSDFGYDSGRNYGIHVAWGPGSNHLIQNNTINSTRHGIVMEGPVNGNVVAYNYILNGIVYNDENYVTGDASNHGAHPYMNLWEGNYIDGRLSFDHTHGGGSHNTIFRNAITRGPVWKTGGRRAIDLQNSQHYINVVGNVLGFSGMSGCVYELISGDCAIYRLGFDQDSATVATDPNVKATLLRWGNFDYVTNITKWNTTERPDNTDVTHSLPASLYLSSKPSWFGSLAWPAIGPDVSLSNNIPAKYCYDQGSMPNCLTGSFPTTPPPLVTLPFISNLVGSNATSNSTQISWNTNIATNGQAFYGTTASYGLQSALVDNSIKTTAHSLTLSNLSPATLYHFRVTSVDVSNNSTSSPDFIFTTLASVPVGGIIGGGTTGGSTEGRSTGGSSSSGGGITVYIPAVTTNTTFSGGISTTTCVQIQTQKLTRNLYKSLKGEDIKILQNFLISQKYLTPDNATGFFGPLTEKAVQLFQKSQNIVSSGNFWSTGYGMVGPTTRAKINSMFSSTSCSYRTQSIQSLQEQIKILQAQVNALLLKLQKAQ